MHRRLQAVIAAITLAVAAGAVAEQKIAHWVDADGNTHFGSPMFAPAEHEAVEVAPTNGMVPAVYEERRRAEGPTVVNLRRTKFENKRGFRGFAGRNSRGGKRYR